MYEPGLLLYSFADNSWHLILCHLVRGLYFSAISHNWPYFEAVCVLSSRGFRHSPLEHLMQVSQRALVKEMQEKEQR